ncbi:ferritin-like domain-containing protein [Halalkalicoccus ordinarius]|uniref:ferritin-like domain-containing protein n=1 Tax=Halalkalicoccus ordinarius TaxID=3116651 RepID=UPI00300F4694
MGDQLTSRRSFLAASAVVGASAFGAIPASASEHGEEGMSGEMPPTEFVTEGEFEDDVDILNYARLLEFLEADFYRQALENMSERDLVCSEPIRSFGDPIQDRVYGDLQTILEHEETHAEVLGATIEDLGGEPIDEPEFEFGAAVEEPMEFLATAALLEDTGVSAYAGAAPSIENAELVPPALSIHSVEARHASFLRVLSGEIGFPAAFDEPLSRAEVEEAASQFIVQ